jgi:hypothetical protein
MYTNQKAKIAMVTRDNSPRSSYGCILNLQCRNQSFIRTSTKIRLLASWVLLSYLKMTETERKRKAALVIRTFTPSAESVARVDRLVSEEMKKVDMEAVERAFQWT